jgi:maltose O-acetyltransferase
MGDYVHRVTTALLASEFLPAKYRTKLMRRLGFDVSGDLCIWAGATLRSKNISVGSGVFINVGFFHDGFDHLRIGNNVRIGQFVRVITATHDIGPASQRGLIEVVGRPVTIKDGTWIGSGVTILPGATIGEGCVLAVNAVVMDSTVPNGLYAGNPARLVRELEP